MKLISRGFQLRKRTPLKKILMIKNRFEDMIVNLLEAYAALRLPQVLTTAAVLATI